MKTYIEMRLQGVLARIKLGEGSMEALWYEVGRLRALLNA